MQGAMGDQVVVSGINRGLLKKGSIALLVLLVLGALVLFSTPAKYYFRSEHEGLSLCKGRLWGFIGSSVEGYELIPVSAPAAQELVGKPYDSVEAALAELRPIVETAAMEGLAAVAPQEKALADAYKTVLPNVEGAVLLGVGDYQVRAKAMARWMEAVAGAH
ncbi:hypothetical protein SAMN02746041_02428 [Desulfacinum hydrothermale DSM 13146]|uniref:Uncharacterized protein n=1 Tax=Desulfacinum hydrothermale DSM 13146 TaxID=1121390 RepID=A0A1W1XQJ2_9BACT|nr:hypothetical protein [Desulfacinum hydrothermale]SMC25781.1 hypothetical protein SAMN02746041_02428 [Desulfacinum hydrothermale DSM 13146]